ERLVAHIATDEPPENAAIVCSLYLADVQGRRCRRLTPEDLDAAPVAAEETLAASAAKDSMDASGGGVIHGHGCVYRLQAACSDSSIPDLRWHRHPPYDEHGCA